MGVVEGKRAGVCVIILAGNLWSGMKAEVQFVSSQGLHEERDHESI
jgi:hypothetical protein